MNNIFWPGSFLPLFLIFSASSFRPLLIFFLPLNLEREMPTIFPIKTEGRVSKLEDCFKLRFVTVVTD